MFSQQLTQADVTAAGGIRLGNLQLDGSWQERPPVAVIVTAWKEQFPSVAVGEEETSPQTSKTCRAKPSEEVEPAVTAHALKLDLTHASIGI